ncbi:MAG: hypothetical protein QXZ57_01380 [Nitrososphaerota archaeon]
MSRDSLLNTIVLTAFITQTLHMIEHSAQMYQHVVLGLPAKLSNGLLFFLDLEWNHFLFNTLYLTFLIIIFARLKPWLTTGLSEKEMLPILFTTGLFIQSYHVLEHTYRMYEFLTIGCTPCSGILGRFFDMVHFHFFLNLAAYPLIAALFVKAGGLRQLLNPSPTDETHEAPWHKLVKSPAPVLGIVLVYGLYTGYSVEAYLLGTTVFTAIGVALFLSIFEGDLIRNIMDAIVVAFLAVMCITSYFSALAIVLVSLFSARVLQRSRAPALNYIAFSFAAILTLSMPSLVASRWGNYNLYTFFTLLLFLGLSINALSKTTDIVLAYITTWITLFIPFELARLAVAPGEALLLLPSHALKVFTNPILILIAFFIVPLQNTFPPKRWRIVYPIGCVTISFLLSYIIPIDVAAFSGIALANIAYIVVDWALHRG